MGRLKTIVVYDGLDNTFAIRLKQDIHDGNGMQYVDLSSITEITLTLATGVTVTNAVATAFPIKWEFDPVVAGKIEFQIGEESLVVTGSYKNAYIVLKDLVNTDGVRWRPNLPIKVV